MGYHSSLSLQLGSLYLNTKSLNAQTYCKQNYQVNLVSGDNGSNLAKGEFSIHFRADSANSSIELLDNAETIFGSNSSVVKLVSLDNTINNEVTSLFVAYEKVSFIWGGWYYDDKWNFEYIELLKGDDQSLTKYCPSSRYIMSGSEVEFNKCWQV